MKEARTNMELQKILYTSENATPEIVESIRSRVKNIGDGIIAFHQVPRVSPFTAKIVFDEIKRLIQNHDRVDLIVDVRESQRQDANARKAIEEYFGEIKGRVHEMVLIIGGNLLVRASVIFIVRATGKSFNKVCGSIEEAVEYIKSKRTAA